MARVWQAGRAQGGAPCRRHGGVLPAAAGAG